MTLTFKKHDLEKNEKKKKQLTNEQAKSSSLRPHISSIITDSSNRPFAAIHSRGTNPPCWRAKVALGQDKERKLPFQVMYIFCLPFPSATFTLQCGGFVLRKWVAAKGLFTNHTAAPCCKQ